MKVFFEENPGKTKPLVCRGCAGRTLGYEKACCQENEFLNVLKQNFIDGTNIQYFKEILGMSQGCENFCEDHGCLYEFILTPKNIFEDYNTKIRQFSLENQILACKKCLVEHQTEKRLHQYHVELLNEEYFSQNDKTIIEREIKGAFEKMDKALREKDLEQKKNEVETRKQLIQNFQKQMLNEQQLQQNQDQEDIEKRKQQIKLLEQMKKAQEVRIQAIASQDGFHDYLHDDYLEGESVRQMIIGEDNNQALQGYSVAECYKMFDNIQFI